MDSNICILHIYWGKLPHWFPHFQQSCNYNSSIKFIFLTDSLPSKTDRNIDFIQFTKNDFNILASKQLGFKVAIENSYKICDFKPAFGVIFRHLLKKYRFWGYCDNDMIFGDIRSFITSEILKQHDIVSTYRGFISGPFCIYRNTSRINNLFSSVSGVRQIFQEATVYQGFDENIMRDSYSGFSMIKVLLLLRFIFFGSSLRMIHTPKEFRYQFQWYFKRHQAVKNEVLDITDACWKSCITLKIRCFCKELLQSDALYERLGRKEWHLRWEEGNLKNIKTNNELMGFHFILSKNDPRFLIKSEAPGLSSFILSNNSHNHLKKDSY